MTKRAIIGKLRYDPNTIAFTVVPSLYDKRLGLAFYGGHPYDASRSSRYFLASMSVKEPKLVVEGFDAVPDLVRFEYAMRNIQKLASWRAITYPLPRIDLKDDCTTYLEKNLANIILQIAKEGRGAHNDLLECVRSNYGNR